MSNAREIESVLFKRVAGGNVFQAPNPWVFGRTSRYLVSDAQKAALLAIITPRRPVLRIALITTVIVAWAGAAGVIVWALSSHREATAVDVLAIFALVLVPIYLAWVVALRHNFRRMRPILANAPRTQERITNRELRRAMVDAMSMKKTLLLAACWTFTSFMQVVILVTRNAHHPLFGDAQSYVALFTGVLAAGLAVYYLVLAVRKPKAPGAAA
jgi:hypothetical protein